MGRILKFFYLALGVYCLLSVFVLMFKHEYQQMVLSFFLALFNLGLFSLFKKEGSVPQLRLIRGGRR
ncbi:hypothetical protein DRW41_04090 [Neobacillus piezotolerans]|uniref:Uncharacterized protein n=1 Tax=Neobacillus piezotolerans TaxID=2259171 RepID=A0A3D8GWC0_9BACI|nr:hypothetical protein [Neobacillus piezotolerans]RDU38748.1 hypothetical protein DRW41_04090 [Neobacillus piezotolerans]